MLKIGLTGGVASGKSTVARMFQELGAALVDTDAIAREVVEPGEPGLAAIRAAFGDDVVGEDGRLDRRRLRSIVFADDAKRRRLEAILHPLIRKRVLEQIEELGPSDDPYVVIAVPLLVETSFGKLVDRVLVVDCPVETQLERLTARDGVDEREAQAMIDAQVDRATRLVAADDVVDNGGDLEATRRQVEQLHRRYRDLATVCRPRARRAEYGVMVHPAEKLTFDDSPEDGLIRFEQPLTERMRTFLRIEFLFQQASFHAQDPTYYGTRAAVASLLEILTILGRGDARAEVLKELERHAEMLGRYRQKPGVDTSRLDGLIQNLTTLRSQLAEAGPQFMNPLKESDFLSTIRHRSAIPGGTCVFDLPDYGYWLHLPYGERALQLDQWIDKLRPICDPVSELLWLTRETNQPTYRVATGGLYQHNLPRTEQFNMVRVLVPATGGIFPEISAGQHRFTVRFVEWHGVDQRPTQVARDVRFLLSLC